MDYIGPLGRFLHQGQVALGKAVALRLDDGLDDGEFVVFQQVVRLFFRVVVVGAGNHPDLVSGFFQVRHGAAGRRCQSVSCGI